MTNPPAVRRITEVVALSCPRLSACSSSSWDAKACSLCCCAHDRSLSFAGMTKRMGMSNSRLRRVSVRKSSGRCNAGTGPSGRTSRTACLLSAIRVRMSASSSLPVVSGVRRSMCIVIGDEPFNCLTIELYAALRLFL